MKNNRLVTTAVYEPPQVEVIEVEVEKGFATSNVGVNVTGESWNEMPGGSLGTY